MRSEFPTETFPNHFSIVTVRIILYITSSLAPFYDTIKGTRCYNNIIIIIIITRMPYRGWGIIIHTVSGIVYSCGIILALCFLSYQGLHPESHGIVNNKFYDSGFEANFTIKDTKKGPATQRESRWWLAEPVSGMEQNHARIEIQICILIIADLGDRY